MYHLYKIYCKILNCNKLISNHIKTLSNISNVITFKNKITSKTNLPKGPTLREFINLNNKSSVNEIEKKEHVPYISQEINFGEKQKVYFDIFGCQMNVNDTEIMWSILKNNGYLKTNDLKEADVVLIITCAIREGAESKIWNRLEYLKGIRNVKFKKSKKQMKIGILGCMAERLKHKMLEKEGTIDLIAGPDSYKDLPRLLSLTDNNQKAVNVLLSLDETYADIRPVRLNQNAISAFVSIMRGCDNMCTYCIVPFTRGRERSRSVNSIVNEIQQLVDEGVKEVTLLGQNVNSYRDLSQDNLSNVTSLAKGFKTVYKPKIGGLRFADLLNKVAEINPELRIRFTSPHPKDFPDEVLQVIKSRANVCKQIHLPAQSGNSEILEKMRRGYTREAYIDLVKHIRETIPAISLSSDFICGFCGETEEQFQDTLNLIKFVNYNMAYLFPYSMREKTTAHRRYLDDVPTEVKQRRLHEMVTLFRNQVELLNKAQIGQKQLVLVEGFSKRSHKHLMGKNDGNTKVIFPNIKVPINDNPLLNVEIKIGDYVVIEISEASSQILKGIPLYLTTLSCYEIIKTK